MNGCPSISDDNFILAHLQVETRMPNTSHERIGGYQGTNPRRWILNLFEVVGRIGFSYFRGSLVALLRGPNDKRWIGEGPCLRSSSMCALVG